MLQKKWYYSKTVWLNLFAMASIYLQIELGFLFSPELQTGVLSLINLWLRKVTKEEIVW
jgi:hypothetical protein